MMLIAFDIVENKGKSVAGGKIANRAFQGQSVNEPDKVRSGAPKLRPGLPSAAGSMASSIEISDKPFFLRCISTTLMASRCSQVEKAESPRKLEILRCS